MNERVGASVSLQRRHVACTVGLGFWLATMLLYSNNVTPFQRCPGASLFVGDFAPASLAFAAAASLAVALASLRGSFIPGRALTIAGGALYVAGTCAFAACACLGDGWIAAHPEWGDALPGILTLALAACVGLGCVGCGLAWGRAYKGLSAREALSGVAGAALLTAALGALGTLLPDEALACCFSVGALLAAVLPAIAGLQEPDCEASPADEGDEEYAGQGRPLRERLRAFASVAAPALTGLLAFAFVMGTMRALIVESYGMHLGVLALCACALAALARSGRRAGSSMRDALRGLIPTLAVLQLAAANVTSALWGGSPLDMFMIFLLYTLAALLTLTTLTAVAHAGEFPCDLVFSVALLLFCLMSILGLQSSEVMNAEQIKVSTTLITTAYAFAMVMVGGLRGRASSQTEGVGGKQDEDAHALGMRAGDRGPRPEELSADTRYAACAERFHLTTREREVLALLACGLDSAQISAELYISQNTVRSHVHNLCRKTGAASREELVGLVKGA